MARLSTVLAAMLCLAAASADPLVAAMDAFAADGECDGADAATCALNAMQLRSSRSSGTAAQQPVDQAAQQPAAQQAAPAQQPVAAQQPADDKDDDVADDKAADSEAADANTADDSAADDADGNDDGKVHPAAATDAAPCPTCGVKCDDLEDDTHPQCGHFFTGRAENCHSSHFRRACPKTCGCCRNLGSEILQYCWE